MKKGNNTPGLSSRLINSSFSLSGNNGNKNSSQGLPSKLTGNINNTASHTPAASFSLSRSLTSAKLDNTYSIKIEDIRSLNNKLKFLSEDNMKRMNEK
jgi:hypothetical protein